MDQPAAQPPETPQTPDEAWRRFTLLDLLILFSGHEAALGIMKWYGGIDALLRSPIDLLTIIMFCCVFFLLGGAISFPLVLIVQFFSRHRRKGISSGEITAFLVFLFWMFFYSLKDNQLEIFRGPAGYIIFYPLCLGGLLFFLDFIPKRKPAPCRWLNRYGYFLSLISAVGIVAYCIIVAIAIRDAPR